VTERVGHYAFLSYGNEHHDIALNEVGEQARIAGPRDTGLYHFAIEVSSREQMKTLYQRLLAAKVEIEPVDHGISQSFYIDDPDGNGIEIYVDTRKETGRLKWHGQNEKLDVT
jgi:catechol 2,3-dioxygenase